MIRDITGKKTTIRQNQEFLINGIQPRDKKLIADKFNEKPVEYLNGILKMQCFSTYNHIFFVKCSPGWNGIK